MTKDRTVSAESLPFPPTPSASIAGRTMQESVYKRRVEPRRLPEDAPNILIVLIDDAGPGLPTTFGGEVNTPTMDRIVGQGIAYNRFHTTTMCSPTRASMLTGRNHHRVGNGQIAELANDWDGYAGTIPAKAPRRQGEDRGRDGVCRAQPGWPLKSHYQCQGQAVRRRGSPGQRTTAL